MTDENNQVESAEGEANFTEEAAQQDEKMVPQSEVNRIASSAKRKGEAKVQEELQKLQAENERLKEAHQQAPKQSDSIGHMQTVNTDELRQQVYDDIMKDVQEKNRQSEAQKLANQYLTAIEAGAQKYSDFNDVMQNFDPINFPDLVKQVAQMDNTADIMYELVKNPQKLSTMSVLSERDPKSAKYALKRLNESIQKNEEAQEEPNVSEPMSRLKSTPKGQDSGQPSSVRDFKSIYRG